MLNPIQKHILNTRIKFEINRLISFRVKTATILKNAVLRKTRFHTYSYSAIPGPYNSQFLEQYTIEICKKKSIFRK